MSTFFLYGISYSISVPRKSTPNLRLYNLWGDMKGRCYNKNNKSFPNYGGRGISVCDEWKNNSQKFVEWALENNYKQGFQLDRKDNNGNYEPINCQFVTQLENSWNKRNYKKLSLYPTGVTPWYNKFAAKICIYNTYHYLGLFNTIEEASSKVLEAKKQRNNLASQTEVNWLSDSFVPKKTKS